LLVAVVVVKRALKRDGGNVMHWAPHARAEQRLPNCSSVSRGKEVRRFSTNLSFILPTTAMATRTNENLGDMGH